MTEVPQPLPLVFQLVMIVPLEWSLRVDARYQTFIYASEGVPSSRKLSGVRIDSHGRELSGFYTECFIKEREQDQAFNTSCVSRSIGA